MSIRKKNIFDFTKFVSFFYVLVGYTMIAHANKEIEAIHIIERGLQSCGPFTTELLSGGLSGSKIVKVSTATEAYVVRFWNMQWAEYFPQDFDCQLIASDAGYGPKIFLSDKDAGMTVMEYFLPETLPNFSLRLPALVDLLKCIHRGPSVPKGVDKATYLDESIALVAEHIPESVDLDLIREIKTAIFSATRLQSECVPCHRDLHHGNLIYTQNHFLAIDYTWGSMDDPYSDLAAVAIFNCATQEEELQLLRLYLEREPMAAELARLSLMIAAAKIFYGLEFLYVSTNSLNNCLSPSASSKNYMNFGRHDLKPNDSHVFLEYALSLLNEVIMYAKSNQYTKDLCLVNTNMPSRV